MADNIYSCTSCKVKTVYRTIEQLEVHIAENHILCLPFSCIICEFGGRFPTETAIITHMKQCHQLEDEFKFYCIYNEDTLDKRKKISELLQRSINISNNQSSESQSITPCNFILPNKTMDIDITQPKPAKIPRVSVVTAQSQNRCSNVVVIEPNANNHLQVPSIVSKALQPSDTNSTLKSTENSNVVPTNPEKKSTKDTANTTVQRRVHKEKKVCEKKVSESATKGGYNDVNIEHLFDDMDPKQNATDEEQSEGDSSSNKEELPKVCKGIPQHDFELSPTFFATKPSSKLGLVLHKAESEGREHQFRTSRASSVQNKDQEIELMVEDLVKSQIEVANKRYKIERNQFSLIRKDFDRRLKSRDECLKNRQAKK